MIECVYDITAAKVLDRLAETGRGRPIRYIRCLHALIIGHTTVQNASCKHILGEFLIFNCHGVVFMPPCGHKMHLDEGDTYMTGEPLVPRT